MTHYITYYVKELRRTVPPSTLPGCDFEFVSGNTDFAISLQMQRRRNRRKAEITWDRKGRRPRRTNPLRISVKRAQEEVELSMDIIRTRKQNSFMVGRRIANDDGGGDDSAYLQQHTRNSAALERKGSCFWPRRRRSSWRDLPGERPAT